MELWQERDNIINQLDTALSTLRKNGLEYAECEKAYRIAKTKEILRLRDEGYPVTLIQDIVKGLEDIAELDFKRKCADVVYKANGEAINVKKKELESIENELKREWSNARNE